MKKVLLTAVAALVCSAGFAQAPAAGAAAAGSTATKEGLTGEPSKGQQTARDKAQMRVDAKKSNMPMNATGGHTMMDMDTNGDGMISRREYDNYHNAMWKSMKQSKGMVSKGDMDLILKGGPGSR